MCNPEKAHAVPFKVWQPSPLSDSVKGPLYFFKSMCLCTKMQKIDVQNR